MFGLEFSSLAPRSVLRAVGEKVIFVSIFLPLFALCLLRGLHLLTSPRLVTQRAIIGRRRSPTVTHGNLR